mmetsp:Transcript_6430/g.14958  ORF Transcript_6430/g.14958 Transcript_6430/m.14958 type:complete len:393 (+) Transcript_6430:589-1767(+)
MEPSAHVRRDNATNRVSLVEEEDLFLGVVDQHPHPVRDVNSREAFLHHLPEGYQLSVVLVPGVAKLLERNHAEVVDDFRGGESNAHFPVWVDRFHSNLEVFAARIVLDRRHHRDARVGFDPFRDHLFLLYRIPLWVEVIGRPARDSEGDVRHWVDFDLVPSVAERHARVVILVRREASQLDDRAGVEVEHDPLHFEQHSEAHAIPHVDPWKVLSHQLAASVGFASRGVGIVVVLRRRDLPHCCMHLCVADPDHNEAIPRQRFDRELEVGRVALEGRVGTHHRISSRGQGPCRHVAGLEEDRLVEELLGIPLDDWMRDRFHSPDTHLVPLVSHHDREVEAGPVEPFEESHGVRVAIPHDRPLLEVDHDRHLITLAHLLTPLPLDPPTHQDLAD